MFSIVSKTNLSNKYNLAKDVEYSLNGFNVTNYFLRIFELTNQRRGRENSKLKNGPNLDQSIVMLGPNFKVKSVEMSSTWSGHSFLSSWSKLEMV